MFGYCGAVQPKSSHFWHIERCSPNLAKARSAQKAGSAPGLRALTPTSAIVLATLSRSKAGGAPTCHAKCHRPQPSEPNGRVLDHPARLLTASRNGSRNGSSPALSASSDSHLIPFDGSTSRWAQKFNRQLYDSINLSLIHI